MKDSVKMFRTVKHIKFVQIINFNEQNSFKEFVMNFSKLDSIEGITTDLFDPLKLFIESGKRVPKVFWSPGENENTEKILSFLEFNKTEDLTLYGGRMDVIELNTLHLGEHTKKLCLKSLISYKIDRVLESLPPSLTSFEVITCD